MIDVELSKQLEPRVYVVDDDEDTRRIIERALSILDYDVETFDSAEQFLEAYRPENPGCLILDVMMPGLSGLELQQVLKDRDWSIPVILVSANANVPLAVQAMEAGAVAVIEKPIFFSDLINRIQQAFEQDSKERSERRSHAIAKQMYETLTTREREVLVMVVGGLLSKQIATRIGTSERTVEVHRSRVMKKMNAGSVADLTAIYLNHGLVSDSQGKTGQ